MKVYLAKFVIGDKVAYKIGHTKYFHSIKRFEDEQYSIFDSITVLRDINIQHENASIARLIASAVEGTLQCVYPKNFRLEQYFNMQENTFDNLSGITEMFVLTEQQSEENLIDLFRRVSGKLYWVLMENKND